MSRRRPAPALLVHLGTNALLGAVVGWLTVGALLVMTPLGPLLLGGPDAPLALVMLFASFTVTFGSAAMGTAVFLLPKEADDGDGPRPRGLLAPARIRAESPQPGRVCRLPARPF